MQSKDHYGNPISTSVTAAADAYVDGVSRFLSARPGIDAKLHEALAQDPNFAMAHLAMARYAQVLADKHTLKHHLSLAGNLAGAASPQEQSLIAAMTLLLTGKVPIAYAALCHHLQDYPNDAMAAQTCVGVFGLIGFSGKRGREAEQLAFTTQYLPHFKDDPWFLGQHAFSQCEVGQMDAASDTIARALEGDAGNAHNAHVNAHILYEQGQVRAGFGFLQDWWKGHDNTGFMACHVSWHVGISAIELGETDTMWAFVDAHVNPDSANGPPINILTDYVAFLFRLFCAGRDVPQERWAKASDYAQEVFPNPGMAFVDVHAAVAHLMAGRGDLITALIKGAKGPAGDIARDICTGFYAMAQGNYGAAEKALRPVLSDSERIGGSRAQRDLLDFAYVHILRQQSRAAEARQIIALLRPHISHDAYTH